ncbi:MAG: hypothetical protein U1F10_14865 [Burkholderiales bacterium]
MTKPTVTTPTNNPRGIEYAPPKSASFGHAALPRDPRRAWPAIRRFLAGHTINCELSGAPELAITIVSDACDRDGMLAAWAEATDRFGAPTATSGDSRRWTLPPAQLDAAVAFALEDDRRPPQPVGPVHLSFFYVFDWRDLPNHPPAPKFPRALTASRLGVHLGGGKAFVQPALRFAASDADPAFVARLRALEAAMPFKPKDDCYCRVEPKATGRGDRLVRLAPGWKGTG